MFGKISHMLAENAFQSLSKVRTEKISGTEQCISDPTQDTQWGKDNTHLVINEGIISGSNRDSHFLEDHHRASFCKKKYIYITSTKTITHTEQTNENISPYNIKLYKKKKKSKKVHLHSVHLFSVFVFYVRVSFNFTKIHQ